MVCAVQGAILSKAGFLAELKGQSNRSTGAVSTKPIGGLPDDSAAAAPVGTRRAAGASAERADSPEGGEPGWDVLKAEFSGVAGGTKLKDWDKREESDNAPAEELVDESNDSDSDVGAW